MCTQPFYRLKLSEKSQDAIARIFPGLHFRPRILADGEQDIFLPRIHANKLAAAFPDGKVGDQILSAIPCGRCGECRLAYSKAWAARCVAELQYYDRAAFVTLTYDDDHLPYSGETINPWSGEFGSFPELKKRDFTLFLKRLREAVRQDPCRHDQKIRFFGCGEYGDRGKRPHFHAIIFGFDFPDRKVHSVRSGNILFTSKLLSSLWTFGFSTVAEVNAATCSYVARYVDKKQFDYFGVGYYSACNVANVQPMEDAFIRMSRRPGVGSKFLEDNDQILFLTKRVVLPGVDCALPRYYDDALKRKYPDLFEDRKTPGYFRTVPNGSNMETILRSKEINLSARARTRDI